jgi:hypothetical protein
MDWEDLNWENFCESIKRLPEKPGTYAIRWVPGGKPQQIQRVFGLDQSGILCFGETGETIGLKKRLNGFYRAAEGKRVPHAEGERYYELKYNKGFPLGELQIGYRVCTDGERAKITEILWFDEYEKLFGELPPLNQRKG